MAKICQYLGTAWLVAVCVGGFVFTLFAERWMSGIAVMLAAVIAAPGVALLMLAERLKAERLKRRGLTHY